MSDDISSAISGIGDSIGNLFSSGAGAAGNGTASASALDGMAGFTGGDALASGAASASALDGMAGFTGGDALASGAASGFDSAAGATIGNIAGTGAGSSGGGFDLSGFGGHDPVQASVQGPSGALSPGGISVTPTVPTASAAPSATFGSGVPASAAVPPGDFGASSMIGDLKNFDSQALNTGIAKAGAVAPAPAFGSTEVPDQSFLGKPELPGAAAVAGGAAAAAGTNSILRAIHEPNADNIMTALGNNSGALLGGAMLGLDSTRSQNLPQQVPMTGQAQQLNTQGAELMGGLTTGTLPAGADAALAEAAAAQKAHIRSQYAGMGLSGSTMEQQALNQVDTNIEAQRFDQIQKLVATGIQETQLSSQIYQQLQNSTLASDSELSQALANFAAAAGGGSVQQRRAS